VNSAELQVFFNLMHSFKCEEYAPCSEIQFVETALEMGQKQHDLCKWMDVRGPLVHFWTTCYNMMCASWMNVTNSLVHFWTTCYNMICASWMNVRDSLVHFWTTCYNMICA